VARLVWLVLACVLAGCAAPDTRTAAVAPPRAVEITLLQINDAYVLEPVDGGRRGGMARLATLVKRLRAAHPNVVFAHAGDLLSPSPMSTVLRGAQMISVLNALGLDVATFGNHEFDFGAAVLRERMAESRFVWLSATPSSVPVTARSAAPPATACCRAAVSTSACSGSRRRRRPRRRRAVPTSTSATPRPRARPSPPICAGAARTSSSPSRTSTCGPTARVAAAADVDVILGGHEHEPLVAEEGKAVITKAGSDARYLVEVDVWLRPDGALVERSWTFHEVSAPPAGGSGRGGGRARLRGRLGRALALEVGRTTVPLEARRGPLRTQESNLGDFVADAMRARLDADVGLVNGGGLRTDA